MKSSLTDDSSATMRNFAVTVSSDRIGSGTSPRLTAIAVTFPKIMFWFWFVFHRLDFFFNRLFFNRSFGYFFL